MAEGLRIGSLFSGYGGLDLAVEQAFPGAVPAWFCEFDDAPARILAHHWPDVPNLRDVTTVDWSAVEPVDIITGGYPCQPFSAAGRRKGTDDDRHLWPYVRETVRVLRPRYVILENVAGHRSLGFDRVLGDMAEDGMHVWWTSVRASDVGAPHHRERLFILATPTDADGERGKDRGHGGRVGTQHAGTVGGDVPLSDADGLGRDGRRSAPLEAGRAHTTVDRHGTRIDWGTYGPAVRRWERLTRPAPAPTEPNTAGRPRLSAAFAEWMMGLPAGHVTGVGLPRTAQLKAIGNGVCPQQAAAALEQLLALEAVRHA